LQAAAEAEAAVAAALAKRSAGASGGGGGDGETAGDARSPPFSRDFHANLAPRSARVPHKPFSLGNLKGLLNPDYDNAYDADPMALAAVGGDGDRGGSGGRSHRHNVAAPPALRPLTAAPLSAAPLVSVIVADLADPIRVQPEHIQLMLHRIFSQTYTQLEAVFAVATRTPNQCVPWYAVVPARYASRVTFACRYITDAAETQWSVGRMRNWALLAARGELAALWSDGEFYASTRIAQQVALQMSNPDSVANALYYQYIMDASRSPVLVLNVIQPVVRSHFSHCLRCIQTTY